jgi:hypothetical protein
VRRRSIADADACSRSSASNGDAPGSSQGAEVATLRSTRAGVVHPAAEDADGTADATRTGEGSCARAITERVARDTVCRR